MNRGDRQRQWGLRGRGAGDLSRVAEQYGGGGHANAAGFVTDCTWKGDVDGPAGGVRGEDTHVH